MIFSVDRYDSPMTAFRVKCHLINSYPHKRLSCSGDRSDRTLNFSAGRGCTKNQRKSVCVVIRVNTTDGIEKGVTSVTRTSYLLTPPLIELLTEIKKPVTGLSPLSTKPLSLRETSYTKEVPMNYKIIYGTGVKLTDADKDMFSKGKFECRHLLQTLKGKPVAVSHCSDPDEDYWKVEYDYSCVVFATEQDALDFCKRRFCDLSGRRLYRRKDDV